MSRLGTDVLALVCIAGGAAVGGLFTMGLSHDGHDEHVHSVDTGHAVECAAVEDVGASSRVVVTVGERKARKNFVVTTPRVRVHQPHCVSVGSVDWENEFEFELQEAQVRMEQARMEMEMAREMMELRVIDLEGLDVTLEGLGVDLNLNLDDLSDEIEQSLQLEMTRLEEELKRLDEIGR